VENTAKFNASAYPLIATVYAHLQPNASGDTLSRLSTTLPATNRDPSKLTVVAMTGVTAMVRLTAAEMDQRGPGWPAEVVGPELATADITAISNEVPFVADCKTNTDRDNLVFCSKPAYMQTLKASGADIIGLTGNHQNDFGLEDALASLDIYADAGLPVYGGGADKEKADAPLFIEHNGNKLAFLGANSYGPESAWATDFSPGSAPFDLTTLSASIRTIKEAGDADVVFAELQYQESYDVTPLYDQRLDFSALARAGADVVTGVQSHVPQTAEFVDGHLVLYGLGNLYFDQMWTEDTREGLIVKHTIYNGHYISTQLLPTLLFDYGQPRWPNPERRAAILTKVFGGLSSSTNELEPIFK
jgi:poly-gamma-glutamate synthesis protein (capsule biosynthesis protein)